MSENTLQSKTVAFLATRGFESDELTKPWHAVEAAGGKPVLVSLEPGTIKGLVGDWEPGHEQEVDVVLPAQAGDYDALVLPGGTLNADALRTEKVAQEFVQGFLDADKPVAVICHGGWILIELGAVRGKRLTSVENIATDMINAGADRVDEEVVVDGTLVSSRTPDDLPAFCQKLVEVFSA